MNEGRSRGYVRVVGTAHVSQDSALEVEETIREERPDVVAVELDPGRYRRLRGDSPDEVDPRELLRGGPVFRVIVYWLLSYVQARLGEEFGIRPGGDMLAAIETAEELGIDLTLIDRDIRTTLSRVWTRMSLREKVRVICAIALGIGNPRVIGMILGVFVGSLLGAGTALLGASIGAVFLTIGVVASLGALFGSIVDRADHADAEGFDLKDMTDADVASATIREFRELSPGGARALIDERDAYMARRLIALREHGLDVIAVVGAGHRSGIERFLANPETLPPPESLSITESDRGVPVLKVIGALVSLVIIAFFVLVAMAGVRDAVLLRLFAAWFAINGVFAAGLARLAGAHASSAVAGGSLAWLTSLNPLLAPGWLVGYLELRRSPVSPDDVDAINRVLTDGETSARQTLSELFDVSLFRLVVIVALTNAGSVIASLLFVIYLLPMFASVSGGMDAVSRLMVEGATDSADSLWNALPAAEWTLSGFMELAGGIEP